MSSAVEPSLFERGVKHDATAPARRFSSAPPWFTGTCIGNLLPCSCDHVSKVDAIPLKFLTHPIRATFGPLLFEHPNKTSTTSMLATIQAPRSRASTAGPVRPP